LRNLDGESIRIRDTSKARQSLDPFGQDGGGGLEMVVRAVMGFGGPMHTRRKGRRKAFASSQKRSAAKTTRA
jgi:hypothetical protein